MSTLLVVPAIVPVKQVVNNAFNPVFVRESMPRDEISVLTVGMPATTGIMRLDPVYCYAGDVITNISLRWGTTAATTPTHWWFALYDTATVANLLGQTADQLTTAIPGTATTTLPLAGGPVTLTATGIYWVATMVTAAATPTVAGKGLGSAVTAGGIIAGQHPIAATAGAGLTTTAPGTVVTTVATSALAYVALN